MKIENIVFGLLTMAVCVSGIANYQMNKTIQDNVERVKVETIVSSGKAIYMPGSVCIIKATSEVNITKMREFAAACIKSHENWLLINNQQSSYDHETLQEK